MTTFKVNVEPFQFEAGRVGCLLIHGFLGTPYEVREWGEYLAQRGISAQGVRLAGHCLSAAEMNRTAWPDWWASARQAFEAMARRYDPLFVGGMSMGATISLHLAAHYPGIAGIVPCAPAIRLEDPRLLLARIPALPRFLPYVGNPNDIQEPGARNRHPCYDQIPTRCLISLLQFLRHVQEDLPEVRAPMLLIQARQDRAVPASNPGIVMSSIRSAEKEVVWLERGGHVVTVDYDKAIVFERSYQFIARQAGIKT